MRNLITSVLIMVMISLSLGLVARPVQNDEHASDARNLIRPIRFIPVPNPSVVKRALVLTEYIEQDYWNEWTNVRKVNLEYDNHLNPQILLTQEWDDWDEFWYDFEKETATYNASGKVQEVITEWWDGTAWIQNSSVEYIWTGDRIQRIKHWSYYDIEPTLAMEIIFQYNDQTGRLATMITETAMGDMIWTMRVNFSWDAPGRVSEVHMEMLLGETWFPMSKSTVSYLPQDQSTYDTYYNFLTRQLVFGDHDLYQITGQILMNEELEYEMDEEMQWELYGKTTYSYDSSYNMIQAKYYNTEEGPMALFEQEDFIYDEHGNPLTITYSEVVNSVLEPRNRQLNSFSEVTSTEDHVNPVVKPSIRVYPNPFNPETNIAFDLAQSSLVSLDIFNLKGQKVRNLISEVKPAGKHQIVFNGIDDKGRALNSGIYFVRLNTTEGNTSRKLILQK